MFATRDLQHENEEEKKEKEKIQEIRVMPSWKNPSSHHHAQVLTFLDIFDFAISCLGLSLKKFSLLCDLQVFSSSLRPFGLIGFLKEAELQV